MLLSFFSKMNSYILTMFKETTFHVRIILLFLNFYYIKYQFENKASERLLPGCLIKQSNNNNMKNSKHSAQLYKYGEFSYFYKIKSLYYFFSLFIRKWMKAKILHISLTKIRSTFQPQGPRSSWEWNVSTESLFLSYPGQQVCSFSDILNILKDYWKDYSKGLISLKMRFSKVVICSLFIRHTNIQTRESLEMLVYLINEYLYLGLTVMICRSFLLW